MSGAVVHGHKAALALDAFTYLSRDASYNAVAARLDCIMAPTHMLSAGWAGSCSHQRDVQPSDHALLEASAAHAQRAGAMDPARLSA
jgi:hypothetical protein